MPLKIYNHCPDCMAGKHTRKIHKFWKPIKGKEGHFMEYECDCSTCNPNFQGVWADLAK